MPARARRCGRCLQVRVAAARTHAASLTIACSAPAGKVTKRLWSEFKTEEGRSYFYK
jgi:hypothetical protein